MESKILWYIRNMNKKSALFFLIVCMVLISTFGVFAISMTDHNEHTTCPMSVFSDGGCSYLDNALAMAIHHISGIQTLTEATLAYGASIVLIILSALIITYFIKPADFIDNLITNFRYIYIRYTAHPVFARILKWIALRNKMDTYSYARASGSLIS